MNQHFIIPKHLVYRCIPKSNPNPLQMFSENYPVEMFGDITIDHLKSCYRENQILFVKVMKQMAFFGISFFQNLKSYSLIDSPEQAEYLWIDNALREAPFNPVMPEFIIRTLRNNGLFTKGDLVGIPIDSFVSIDDTFPFFNFFRDYGYTVLEYSQWLQYELGENSEATTDTEFIIRFQVDGREIWLPSSYADKSIYKEDFPNCPKLIEGLWNRGYKKWTALPLELDNLLYQIKGTGRISIKKFADRLEYLLANESHFVENQSQFQGICKVPSVKILDDLTNIKYLMTKDRIIIIPDVLLDEQLSTDKFPNSKSLIREFIKLGIIRYKEIPTNLDEFCLQLKNVGKVVVKKFVDTLIGECQAYYQEGEEFIQPLIRYALDEHFISIPKLYCQLPVNEFAHRNPQLESFINTLSEAGYCKIHELPTDLSKLPGNHLDRQDLFDTMCEIFGFTDSSFSFLFNQLIDTLKQLLPENDTKPEFINERGWKLLLIKYNMIRDGQKVTLEALGESLGVTRERARQILVNTVKKVVALYESVFNKVVRKLERCGKIVGIEVFFPIEELHEFSYFILKEVLNGKGISCLDGHGIMTMLSSGELEDLNQQFKTYLVNHVGHQVVNEKELQQMIQSFLDQAKLDSSAYRYFYHLTVHEVLISNDGGSLYILRNLNKNEIALMALREFPHSLAVYKETDLLREKLNSYGTDLFETNRSLIATLVREPDKALLWGWGVYIHKDHVHVEPDKLSAVVQWIEEQFANGLSQLSSHAAFMQFREMLEGNGVPNEHALYSCIRLFYKDKFFMPKSPKIYPLGQTENYSNIEMVQQFILESGKSGCTYKQLEKEFLERRGWKEYTLQQSFSNSEDIIKVGPSTYGLLESYDHISDEDLESLVVFLKNRLVDDLPYVSINLLFKSKKATCLSLGIENEELLYSLIKKRFGSYFDFPRFPHVCLKNSSQENGISSYRKQVEEFLLEQNISMFREELRNEFIERRGWEQVALDNALTHSKLILPLERGTTAEFVHKNVAGWNDEKQAQLEEWVKDKLDEYKPLDPPYGNVERVLLQTGQLPPLENNIFWTAELLKYLLDECPFIEFIGTKRSLFVPIGNQARIENDVDFLAYLLWKEFGGAAKLSEFKQRLAELDYSYRGEIPKAYQADQSDDLPYYILGDEIISKKL
ncbi:sigma factor-like helix-turn-helix DNA-binding protein [Aneurinibacillus terranovensis]|uniref:sigma factor-like helix-turn-helix DNA-binding protein n=1 Tax=Aneurinibacillus terranovensis TaxID=278991 RepID=UPI00041397A9|nr:sigma factor-like helix-turn-helix DNA-binding protein [Aneurinibacillus terranovensis]